MRTIILIAGFTFTCLGMAVRLGLSQLVQHEFISPAFSTSAQFTFWVILISATAFLVMRKTRQPELVPVIGRKTEPIAQEHEVEQAETAPSSTQVKRTAQKESSASESTHQAEESEESSGEE